MTVFICYQNNEFLSIRLLFSRGSDFSRVRVELGVAVVEVGSLEAIGT